MRTTSDLLALIALRAAWPDASEARFTAAEQLDIATGIIRSHFFPLLVKNKQDWFSFTEDLALVADTESYRLPKRFGRLRDVGYVDANGRYTNMTRMDVGELGWMDNTSTTKQPVKFYLEGANIGVWPKPSQAVGSIRVRYYHLPNTLVVDGATIALAPSDTIITPSKAVSGWTTDAFAGWEVLSDGGAHGVIEKLLGTYAVTPVISSILEFDSSKTRIGDIIAQEGETHVPQVPEECFNLLACRVAQEMWMSTKEDVPQTLVAHLGRQEALVDSYFAERVEGEPSVYVPRFSALRSQWNRVRR